MVLEFYDIASGPPIRPFAPNPWKTRYALNLKKADYQTQWTELLDVTPVRKRLGAPANRTYPDGEPFYTLPVIKNTETNEVVGDTFDIALYLDKLYPDGPTLIKPDAIGLTSAFNAYVDAIFTNHIILMGADNMPLNPATAEETKRVMMARWGLDNWATLTVTGEAREKTIVSFQGALEGLAKHYSRVEGPFLDGDNVSYADLIVGGWLRMASITFPERDRLWTWHDGVWAKLHQALEAYADQK